MDQCCAACAAIAGLAPYYEHLCAELGWTPDQTKLTEMQGANLKQLEELDAKIKASAALLILHSWLAGCVSEAPQPGQPLDSTPAGAGNACSVSWCCCSCGF